MAVNDRKVMDIGETFDQADFEGEGVIIKKGKKVYHRAVVK
jgi:tyrosyl-tRNA synthetase